MKTSFYNLMFEYEDKSVVYNTLSGSLLSVSTKDKDKLSCLFLDEVKDIENNESKDIYKELGMVIENDFDEYSYLKARFWKSKFIDNTMRMMLCTTFNCNFHCDYCFENIPNKKRIISKMSPAVEDAIYHFVEQRIHELKTIDIHWFGGEPLLNTEPIFSLGKRLSQLALDNNVRIIQDIITNGYLLDKKLASKLLESGVSEAQITFDGPKVVHDKRRYCNKKTSSFDRMLKNIIDIQDEMIVKIRVNTDRRNIDDMCTFIDELISAGINSRTRVHFGMARNFNQGALMSNELKADEFRKKIHPVYSYAISKGINIDYGVSVKPKLTVCDAAKRNTIHVGPDGIVWKCFPLIGTSRGQCGNIMDYKQMKVTDSELLYMSYDPFVYEKCRTCKLLPICMRRCPYDDMCLNINNSMCNFYMIDEIKERISLILQSGNKNNNIERIVQL